MADVNAPGGFEEPGDGMEGPPDGVPRGGAGGGGGGSGAGGAGGGGGDDGGRRPASPEVAWRHRAVQAESRLKELDRQVGELRASLAEAQQRLRSQEARRELEALLVQAGANDVELALLAVEAERQRTPDAAAAQLVAQVRQRRPVLFAGAVHGTAGAMGMEPAGPADESLNDMAGEARRSGDRRALLRYMRARRRG